MKEQIFKKGDIILITSAKNKHAGFSGIVEKLTKTNSIIAKVFKTNAIICIDRNDVTKITEKQQREFEDIFKES